MPAVPAGKILVVETISANGSVDPGVQALVVTNINNVYFSLPLTTILAFATATQPVKAYAGPGTVINLTAHFPPTTSNRYFIFTVAGHLEAAPP